MYQESDISELQETVRRFAEAEIAPLAKSVDRDDVFPRQLWPKLGAMGLLAPTVAERWGGTGLGYLAHTVIAEEISRASGSIGISYIAHSNLCVNQLALHGTLQQKDMYLPSLASGESVGALAMSEAGAGSDVVSMKLRAREVDGGFVLDGTKLWTTNGWHADTYIVYAKTAPRRRQGWHLSIYRGALLSRDGRVTTPGQARDEGFRHVRTCI